MRRTNAAGAAALLLGLAAATVAPAAAAETIAYAYDVRGRLVQVDRSGSANDGVSTSYSYDKADNRTSRTTSGTNFALVLPVAGFLVLEVPLQH